MVLRTIHKKNKKQKQKTIHKKKNMRIIISSFNYY